MRSFDCMILIATLLVFQYIQALWRDSRCVLIAAAYPCPALPRLVQANYCHVATSKTVLP